MKFETRNPILIIKDQSLANQFKMKSGNFYCYYKPSYNNGFG